MDKLKQINGIVFHGITVAVLTGTVFGYGTGINSFANESLELMFGQKDLKKYFTSSVTLGALFGCIAGGFVADKLGRIKTLLFANFIGIPANIVMTFGLNWWFVIVGRFFLGITIGIFSSIGPLYLSECSPPKSRGFFGVFFQFSLTFFMFLGSFFAFYSGKHAWRVIIGLTTIPLVILEIALLFFKESPRFLVIQGKVLEAKILFKDIFDSEEEIEKEVKEIIAKTNETPASWKSLFGQKTRLALCIGLVFCVAQQWTGINAIIYYINDIVAIAGVTDKNHVAFACCAIFFANFLFTMVAIKLCEKFGRKILITGGLIIMLVALFICGIVFFIPNKLVLSIICLTSIIVFIFGFEIGIGPLFFVVINEIFPESMRGKIGSLVTGIQWLLNFILSISFPLIINGLTNNKQNMNGYVFFIFAIICALCVLFSFYYVPETKGKSLTEIQELLSGKKKNLKEKETNRV